MSSSLHAPVSSRIHTSEIGEDGCYALEDEVALLQLLLRRRVDDALLRVRREGRHVQCPLRALGGVEREALPRGEVEDVLLDGICTVCASETETASGRSCRQCTHACMTTGKARGDAPSA